MNALLKVEDAKVSFGGVHALDGVSISIEAGSACGIIGPNGSGKTTLLGAISRLTHLTSGRLFFGGSDYAQAPPYAPSRLGIARTFQTVRLLPTASVRKNVMVGAAAFAATRSPITNWLNIPRSLRDQARARAAADEALDRVGMLSHADAMPLDLPYGLQRRVEIARALATGPRLLLLDEPMAGMSHAERDNIAVILQELRAEGLTLLLVEHDLSMIYRICDTSYALDFGHVIASGPPLEVADRDMVREAYLGHSAAAKVVTR